MINKRRINSVYLAVLALCLFLFGLLGGRQMPLAFAEDKVYTNVLADLQKDETFNVINYPEQDEDFLHNKDNVHLQVIQIAESTSGELYLYMYQPCQKIYPLTATEINMSLSETVDGTSLFPLTLLNTNGVFCKYLVNGVIVSSDTTRYYNITSIYRDYIKEIDGETGSDMTKNAVSYSVGKVFKAETTDGNVSYSGKKIDVIQILNPYAGFIRYNDGYKWGFINDSWEYTDSHFIAFDTDLPIDTLQEADVSFYIQPYKYVNGAGYTYEGEPEEHEPITVKGTDKGGNIAGGWFSIKYEWERIKKTTDFIADCKINADVQNAIENTKWVLLFYETGVDRDVGNAMGHFTDYGMRVSNVTILRLKFVTAGKSYNLGAVSDKVTEGNKPSGGALDMGWLDTLCKWLEQVTGVPAWVWKIIICALPFVILLPIFSAIFPVVGQILSAVFKAIATAFVWLFKGLWWLICLPFKGIAALVRKIKERKT